MRPLTPLKILMVFIAILAGIFIYTCKFFSHNPPTIKAFIYVDPTTKIPLDDVSGWNPDYRIALNADDENGIKFYKIRATTNDGLVVLNKEETIMNKPKSIQLWLPKPDINLPDGTILHYDIAITNWNNANFFKGDTIKKKLTLTISTQKPVIEIIASSNKINYGGSALVIFKVNSFDIKELKISNGSENFKAFPFLKEGYYAVILAWGVQNRSFRATISATDSALNNKIITIPLIKIPIKYADSTLKLKEEFLEDKMQSLIESIDRTYPESIQSNFAKFRYINEKVRLEDEEMIRFVTTQNLDSTSPLTPPNWDKFVPLKSYVIVGRFGDSRTYVSSKGEKSLSVHLGLDIASIKNDQIFNSNVGKVLLAKQLGVYGKTILINHGFGLSTLYSHLDQISVSQGEVVYSGSILGLSGQTGWAFGDHLHFGVLIQGIPVRCAEWLDSKWIQHNITNVFEKARNIIEQAQ